MVVFNGTNVLRIVKQEPVMLYRNITGADSSVYQYQIDLWYKYLSKKNKVKSFFFCSVLAMFFMKLTQSDKISPIRFLFIFQFYVPLSSGNTTSQFVFVCMYSKKQMLEKCIGKKHIK